MRNIEDKIRDIAKQIEEEIAICHGVDFPIFQTPLIGFASSSDPLFQRFFTDNEIMYGHFRPPEWWLKGVKSVISIFFPYSYEVKRSNSHVAKLPSKEWLVGRYEGQKIIDQCSGRIMDYLIQEGYESVAPSICSKLFVSQGRSIEAGGTVSNKDFYSNWSERHVAYVAGLGTFGLSKGLITRKGIAGRFTSILTNAYFVPTNREYQDVYEYCLKCGACLSKCPVKAISLSKGKLHSPCSKYIDYISKRFQPRYGCGKCQVTVPCSDQIPVKTLCNFNLVG